MNCFIRQKNILLATLALIVINLLGVFIVVPIYIQLIVQSLATIYIACFVSHELFELWNSKMKANNIKRVQSDEKNTEESDKPEIMSMKDAYMFPVYGKNSFKNLNFLLLLGSAVLFGLYIFCKYISKDLANLVLSFYFTFLGLLSLMAILQLILQPYCKNMVGVYLINKKVSIFKKEIDLKFDKMDLLTLCIGVGPTLLYFFTKHWLLNNLFGIAFSIIGIKTLVVPNFKIGYLLLLGLFFYDIFWVYGTDVMVTVATSIDAPIKLQFPSGNPDKKFSILGLGDIVLPGVLLALGLKLDLENYIKKLTVVPLDQQLPTQTKYLDKEIKCTPYFNLSFIGYALGIIATFVAMKIMEKGQPALLFLVPACCGSLFIVAVIKKEIKRFWEFEDGQYLKELQGEDQKEKKEQ